MMAKGNHRQASRHGLKDDIAGSIAQAGENKGVMAHNETGHFVLGDGPLHDDGSLEAEHLDQPFQGALLSSSSDDGQGKLRKLFHGHGKGADGEYAAL